MNRQISLYSKVLLLQMKDSLEKLPSSGTRESLNTTFMCNYTIFYVSHQFTFLWKDSNNVLQFLKFVFIKIELLFLLDCSV